MGFEQIQDPNKVKREGLIKRFGLRALVALGIVGATGAAVESVSSFATNPDNHKYASENTEMKDILKDQSVQQQHMEDQKQNLMDQVKAVDEAQK